MRKRGQIFSIIVLICLFISIFFILTPFSIERNNSESGNPKTSSSSWSGGVIVQYDEFYTTHGDASEKIDWWYQSLPYNISLIVMIFDTWEFTQFLDLDRSRGLNETVYGFYFEAFIVANSNYSSGEMDLYYFDHWYVVFINLDEDMEASQLEFQINFDAYEVEYIYVNPISILYIIYGLFVSTIIIALIIKVVRKKVILNKPAPVPPYPYKPKTAPKPTSSYNKEDDDQKTLLPKYCPFCGEHMDRDAIFCHQCGNRL